MDLLFVGLLVIFIVIIANVANSQQKKPMSNCPPHKWVYDVTGKLFCTACNKRPGEIETSYDKPY